MFDGIFSRNPHCIQLHYRPTVVYSSMTKELVDFVFWGLRKLRAAATVWPLFCSSVLAKYFNKLLW